MVVPEFFVVLLKGQWIVAPKKQMEFMGTTSRVIEADPGLIIPQDTSTDGSSFGGSLPTYNDRDDQESV